MRHNGHSSRTTVLRHYNVVLNTNNPYPGPTAALGDLLVQAAGANEVPKT